MRSIATVDGKQKANELFAEYCDLCGYEIAIPLVETPGCAWPVAGALWENDKLSRSTVMGFASFEKAIEILGPTNERVKAGQERERLARIAALESELAVLKAVRGE